MPERELRPEQMVLRDAVQRRLWLWVACRSCQRGEVRLDPKDLARRLSDHFPVRLVHRRLKCRGCGQRNATVRLDW